jgi:SNW domain-containing protein 1
MNLPRPRDAQGERGGDTAFLAEGKISSLSPRSYLRHYGNRNDFVPCTTFHFGDGGAFPEIHVPQYPVGGGQTTSTPGHVATVTSTTIGDADFDVAITVGTTTTKVIQTKHDDVLPKPLNVSDDRVLLSRMYFPPLVKL